MVGGDHNFRSTSDQSGNSAMSGVFHFRCLTPGFPRYDAVLVLFSGPTGYDRNAVTDAITEETKKALAPEVTYLLYPKGSAKLAADDLNKHPEVFSPLTEDSSIGVYQFDRDGRVTLYRALRGAPAQDLPMDHLCRQGLTKLFRRHGGALDASPTAHFIRPSTRPSSRFLHASHALSDGAEIYFAALWLLPHLAADIEYVHLDTSTIACVVLAALILKQAQSQPTIRTFHSYEGIKKHPFSPDRSDLVLISASQSGTMARDISGKVGDASRILTLFSSADAPPPTKVICDIRIDKNHNPDGFPPARELSDVLNTRPIRLISEHFIAEPEAPRAVVPVLKDAPTVVKETLAHMVGKNVLIALRQTDIADVRSSVWFDMTAMAKLPIFINWVDRIVNNFVSATTRALVQLEYDEQSAVMANAIEAAVKRQGGELLGVKRLSLSNLEEGESDWSDPGSPVLVTGATSGRGTQLLAASRALRRFAPGSYRVFVAPGTVAISKRVIELLRRNLEQPRFRFETMFELVIDRESSAESWRDERMLLADLLRDTDPAALEERITSLNGHSGGRADGLFLDAPSGPLRLRDNFAFWPPETACTKASQADVFTTICVILENLRSDAMVLNQRLINDALTHTVLDAETFARYNDGVIQASFLRAARPIELNYRDTPGNSRAMLDLLLQMIRYRDRQQGEALAEFLLAIACGRIRLVDRDLAKLREALAGGINGATEMSVWLANSIVIRSDQLPSAK